MWLFILATAIGSLLVCGGCDDVKDALDPQRIEKRLREDPSRPGKVGSFVAVAVHQKALGLTRKLDAAPNPACAVQVGPNQRYILNLDLERRRGETLVSSWKERRSYRVDGTGDLELDSTATFVTEIGFEGTRDAAWRIVGDDSYLGTRGRDGFLWYRRDADEQEGERAEAAGLGSIQALLDAAEGWRADGAEFVADAAGGPLRCVEQTEGRGWVDRFVAAADVRDGRLVASPERRELTVSWQLSDGSVLTARLEDRVESFEDEIAAPEPERVVDVLRDRSLSDAVKLLEKLADEGLVEVASADDE